MALESLPKISPANFSPDNDLIQVYSKKGDYVGVINPSYIKSSPSGVSGAIQFSDGSAFASSSNLTWNNATNALGLGSGTTSAFIDFASNPAGSTTTVGAIRTYVDGTNLAEVMAFREDGFIGIGTTTPTTNLTIYGGSDTLGITGAVNQAKSIQIARYNSSNPLNHYIGDDGNEFFGNGLTISASGGNSQIYLQVASSGRNVNIGTAGQTLLSKDMGARLGVRGSGSTSATTSLLVQNSGGSNALKVRDDGKTAFGNSTVDCTITGTAGSGNKFEFYAFNGYDIVDGFGNVLVTGLGSTIRLPRQVGIGFNTQNNASAILQADSTTQGFLPPRMTDAQIRAIVSPAVGLEAYNTDLDCPVFYSAAGWRKVSHSVM